MEPAAPASMEKRMTNALDPPDPPPTLISAFFKGKSLEPAKPARYTPFASWLTATAWPASLPEPPAYVEYGTDAGPDFEGSISARNACMPDFAFGCTASPETGNELPARPVTQACPAPSSAMALAISVPLPPMRVE